VPYGTGGTAAGLALGLQLGQLASRVIAVRVIDRLVANRPRLEALAWSLARLIRRHAPDTRLPRAPLGNLEILQGCIGPGYGRPTPAGEAARVAFAEGGLRLESTYTAKAAAAFLARARRGTEPLLFWLTYSAADIGRWVADGGGDA
jgi:D-cysteine desulfhydrase